MQVIKSVAPIGWWVSARTLGASGSPTLAPPSHARNRFGRVDCPRHAPLACLSTRSVDYQCLSALLTRENRSGSLLEPGEDEAARLPPVSCLMLVTVILALKFRRFKWTVTAMWIASGVQAHRSKPLWVALSQVGYFFTRADGLCAAGSNRDAIGAAQR